MHVGSRDRPFTLEEVEEIRDVYTYIRSKFHSIGVGANIYIPDPTGHGPDYSVRNIISDHCVETNTLSMESCPQAPGLFRAGI